MMPDISNLTVEQLKKLQIEAEALIVSKKERFQQLEKFYLGLPLLLTQICQRQRP